MSGGMNVHTINPLPDSSATLSSKRLAHLQKRLVEISERETEDRARAPREQFIRWFACKDEKKQTEREKYETASLSQYICI